MAHDDRDRSFEKALAQQLRSSAQAGARNAACPDAQTLAAYHERELSLDELSSWKTHIASCARCQEILASLELTDKIPVGTQEELLAQENISVVNVPELASISAAARQMPIAAASGAQTAQAPQTSAAAARAAIATLPPRKTHWRWTAPVGAIAAGVLVWIVLNENKSLRVPPPPAVEVAVNRDQAASSLPAQPPAATPAPQRVAPHNEPSQYQEADSRARAHAITNPKPNLPAKDSKQAAAPVPPDVSAAAPSVAPQASAVGGALTESKRKSVTNLPLHGRNTSGGRVLAPPAPRPAASKTAGAATARGAAPPAGSGGSSDTASASVSAAPAPPAPAAQKDADKPPQSVTQTVTVTEAAPTVTTGAYVSDNQLQTVGVRPSTQLRAVMPGPPGSFAIPAPGGRTLWKVGPGGAVERTDDAGKTWKPQRSGVAVDLLAGSAPSKKVCWLGGRAGTILWTKNGGKHWVQLPSPIKGDLAAVRASDDLHASVSDTSGKSFETSDGGKTWTPVANP
jgi:hypothetical protein